MPDTYPAATDVRTGVVYGPNDTDFTGTCVVPAATDVRLSVAVDATTGTCVVPGVGDVRAGVTFDVGSTGTYAGTGFLMVHGAGFVGDIKKSASTTFYFVTINSSGVLTDYASSNPVVFRDDTSGSTAGITITRVGVGAYQVAIDTSNSFYQVGHTYKAYERGTLDGVALTYQEVVSFGIQAQQLGVDLGNVGNQNSTLALTHTTVGTVSNVASSVSATLAANAISNMTFSAGTTIPRVALADTLTVYTGNTLQTGDAFARLGAPVGASHSADVAAVKSDTGTILTDVNSGAGAIYTRLGAPAGASISADIAAAKTAISVIQGDTDDIQSRLPAALVGGRMDSSIGAGNNATLAFPGMTVGTASNVGTVIAVGATERDAIATALLDLSAGVETGITLRKLGRAIISALAGKLAISGGTFTFRDTNDTKNRIVATTDATGRLTITLDLS